MKERDQSVLHVTPAGRRRMRVVVYGTVLVLKAAALPTTLEAGEPRRSTRYVSGQARVNIHANLKHKSYSCLIDSELSV